MSPTVHEVRNRIRTAIGRFEREVNAQFTKEELAAIAEALGHDIGHGRPSKEAMRVEIRTRAGIDTSSDASGETFRKADLEAIADALEEE